MRTAKTSTIPHFLILYASVGAGHMRAAEAVTLALRQRLPDAVVENTDILTLTNPTFRRLYGRSYLDMIAKAPHLLGFVYDYLDHPPRTSRRIGDRFRLLVEKLNLGPFIRYLHSKPWDVIINTHFLPAEIIASLNRKKELTIPQMTVTTDFETHRLWVNQPCRLYTTATDEGKANLAAWGVPAENIAVTGIPIHPVFSIPKIREQCLAAQQIPGDRTVILQLAGGFGVGPIEQIYKTIQNIARPLDIIVVAGKNAEARERLIALGCPPRHRCRIIGFTDKMDELLGAADLVITKPGGLTSSETLARGAAMVIVNPIPGQETRNADYLLEHHAAVKANNLATMCHKLEQLLNDPAAIPALKQNAQKIARPKAAEDVARLAVQLLK